MSCRKWLLVGLWMSCAAWAETPSPPAAVPEKPQTLEQASAQRARAASMRRDAETRHKADQNRCYSKFLVSDCLVAAQKRYTEAIVEARKVDQPAREFEREAKRQEVEAKEAQKAAARPQREAAQQESAERHRAEEAAKAVERERKVAEKATKAEEGRRKKAAEQAKRQAKLEKRAQQDAEREAKKAAKEASTATPGAAK